MSKKPSIPSSTDLIVGARASRLSQVQVQEVAAEFPHLIFQLRLIETTGDLDQTTSLRTLDKTDFFTREIDQMLLKGECRIAIHSAKDLPDPLPQGLEMVALTEGLDAADALVFNHAIPQGGVVGVSSERREAAVRAFRSDLRCVDIRGTIDKRLALLDDRTVDAVVIAEAALLRLGYHHRQRILLKGERLPLQGKLAIMARKGDEEMQQLFSSIDIRKHQVLYLGLDPSYYTGWGVVTHVPIIQVIPRKRVEMDLSSFTHLIFTSKVAVQLFDYDISQHTLIAIGQVTAAHLRKKGWTPHFIAEEETQEGLIALLETIDLKNKKVLLPRSSRARPLLVDYLYKNNIAYTALDLYDTTPSNNPLPDLDLFDEFVFTSPSVVEAFFQRVKEIPRGKKWNATGPVTSNALQIMMLKKTQESCYDRSL